MTTGLGGRVLFTVAGLLVYRFGSFIPLPGLDLAQLRPVIEFGSTPSLMATFALGITPYLTAALLIQLASFVVAPLQQWKRQGERGRKKLDAWTYGLTLPLAAVPAFGIAVGLEQAGGLVIDPGPLFRVIAALTLVGGTMFLAWLAGVITARGFGNGLALIVLTDTILDLQGSVGFVLEGGRQGRFSVDFIVVMAASVVALTGVLVAAELASRRLMVVFPRSASGLSAIAGTCHLDLKINTAGLVPSLLAYQMLAMVRTVMVWQEPQALGPWADLLNQLTPGRPVALILYGAGVALFALLYPAFLFDPASMAKDIEARGGVIPGVAPGEPSVQHIDRILSALALMGGAYFTVVCVLPDALMAYWKLSLAFNGLSLLIVVCVTLDLVTRLRGERLLRGR